MSLTGKPELTTAEPIVNDGFWPDLSMADLMANYRLPSEYVTEVIKTGLVLALVRGNEKLERAKAAILLLGHATFEAYLTANPEPVAGTEKLKLHYENVIYARAKASLLQQFKTINRRDIAENEAKESEETEQFWLDESTASVAAIMKVFFPDEFHTAKSGFYVASL